MDPHTLTAAERVARLIEKLGISSYQFGKETGLSHQTISNVLTGKNRPSLDTLEAIATRYPDTTVWLLTGKGETRTGIIPKAEAPRAAEPAADYTSGGSTEQKLYISVLKEQVADLKAQVTDLKEDKADLKAEVSELRGKPSDSSDAAGPTETPLDPNDPRFAGGMSPLPMIRKRAGFTPSYVEAAELSE